MSLVEREMESLVMERKWSLVEGKKERKWSLVEGKKDRKIGNLGRHL